MDYRISWDRTGVGSFSAISTERGCEQIKEALLWNQNDEITNIVIAPDADAAPAPPDADVPTTDAP